MATNVGLTMGVRSLWEEELLLDYTIEVEDEQFKVHKVVMASVSDYFKVMLTGGMVESHTDRVRLQDQNPLVVSDMINVIYTGQFDSSRVDTQELLACAVYLQIPAVIEECTGLLVNQVNNVNCFNILSTFQTYNLEQGAEQTTQYIKSNIDDIMAVSTPSEMSSGFEKYVDFWQKSEWELFNCVRRWVQVDYETRKQFLSDLMSRIRFALMTPEQLGSIKDMDIYSEPDGSWHDLISEAEEYHKLPIHQKVLDESEQSRVRGHPVPVFYASREYSTGLFLPTESMKYHEAPMPPVMSGELRQYLVVNNFLIACDAFSFTHQRWHIFNPRTLAWSRPLAMAGMRIPRAQFAVVHHKKHLYALGGYRKSDPKPTDVIERYDFDTNSWQVLPTKLPVALWQHSAGVIGDSVYVTGGYDDLHVFSKRLDSFDISTSTWHSRAPMPECMPEIGEFQVMELGGEEVLFAIDDKFDMHYYSPSANQWSVWNCFSGDVHSARGRQPTVLVDRNMLFIFPLNCNQFSNELIKLTVKKKGEKITQVSHITSAQYLNDMNAVYYTMLLTLVSDGWGRYVPTSPSYSLSSPSYSLSSPSYQYTGGYHDENGHYQVWD